MEDELAGRNITGIGFRALTSRRILAFYAALAISTAFYPVLRGRLPVPAGTALLLLPDGMPPAARNDELADVPMQFLPWTRAVADAYRELRLPFRFAGNGCGVPLWANPQAQAVTPTTVAALLLPLPWAAGAAAAGKLFLAAAGAFLFLRGRGRTAAAACWGGLAYGFSLHMTAWIHFPDTWPAALLPWVLVALDRLARGLSGGFRGTLFGVLLLLLGGYPETEFFVAVAGTAFFLFVLRGERLAFRDQRGRLGAAIAAALLALGLTGAYTLPATLALARSERSFQVARSLESARPTLRAGEVLSLPTYWEVSRFWLVPEAQGNPREQDKFGSYSFAGRASGFSGVLIVAFALAAFFWRRAPPSIVWTRRAVVGLALYILWYPPLTYVLQSTPGLRDVAAHLTTNRANSIAVVLLVLLAAAALDRLQRGEGLRAARAGTAVTLLATLIVIAEYARVSARPPLTAWRSVSFLLPVLLLSMTLALLRAPASARRRKALYAVLLLGTCLELLRIGARFNPGTRPGDYFPVTPAVRAIRDASRGGRLASDEPTFAGFASMYGIQDIRVHGVTASGQYVDTLAATVGYTGLTEYPGRVMRLDAPFLDFLNVRARLGPGTTLAARATPPAVFPEHLVRVPSAALLREKLSGETDFLRNTFAMGSAEERFQGAAEVLSFGSPHPEELRIRVRTVAPRLLAVPETDDGGWRAEANGSALETLTVNGAFLGIRVPAGETAIVCRYVPPGFRAGLGLTAVSALLVAGLAAARRRSR